MTDLISSRGTCPDCGHHECYAVYDDGAYCFSCAAATGDITAKDIVYEYKRYRGISTTVAEHYGAKCGVLHGDIHSRQYPYPHAIKTRVHPKDFSKNKGFTNDYLFGMDKFNEGSDPLIVVTEGEEDAMAAYQMLGMSHPCVAVPGASLTKALIVNCHSYLDSFKEVVVCVDGDAAGSTLQSKLVELFPGKVSVVNLTKHKDANDFLIMGDAEEFNATFALRKRVVPDGVFSSAEDFSKILDDGEINTYSETPLSHLNSMIKGLMQGHLTVITGPEGQGKTELLRLFEYHVLSETDLTIGVLHMEESKKMCLRSLACYALGEDVRDPDSTADPERVKEAILNLTEDGNLFLVEFGIDEDPLKIVDRCRTMAKVFGCKYIFIDPIQQLSYGKNSDKTEEQVLSQIAVQLERLATEIDVGIVITAHVNDDGNTRSSRMIGKSASVRIDLHRDHLNEDAEIRNTTTLTVSKNRPMGKTGYGGQLQFNPYTFTLEEK